MKHLEMSPFPGVTHMTPGISGLSFQGKNPPHIKGDGGKEMQTLPCVLTHGKKEEDKSILPHV